VFGRSRRIINAFFRADHGLTAGVLRSLKSPRTISSQRDRFERESMIRGKTMPPVAHRPVSFGLRARLQMGARSVNL